MTIKEKLEQAQTAYNEKVAQYQQLERELLQEQGALQMLYDLVKEEENGRQAEA